MRNVPHKIFRILPVGYFPHSAFRIPHFALTHQITNVSYLWERGHSPLPIAYPSLTPEERTSIVPKLILLANDHWLGVNNFYFSFIRFSFETILVSITV